ncbi:MAG: hypothetical protein NC089_05250 [Bacteroides sp.]|nr:hypothetical protein [Bacteroides sp.]MCM1549589.1 hypothetical protein [Clostridium sp.]
MRNKKPTVKLNQKINPYQGSAIEQMKKVEKQAFVACIAAVAGFPTAFVGFGLILGIVGLVLGIKAKRPDGRRPGGAIAAIIFGILSIIAGIPGCLVIYGTYINPGSEFIQNLVNAISGMGNMIQNLLCY